MQESLVIKECKKCGAVYYGGQKKMELSPGQLLEVLQMKVRDCPNCPEELGPRSQGYSRINI